MWFFAWICLKIAKANNLVHESVHQNQLSNLMSTHDLRSTQGVNLTYFDTISSILQGTYNKIILYEIGKWFIINIFHKVRDEWEFIHSKEKPHFLRRFSEIFWKMVWRKFQHGSDLAKFPYCASIWRNFSLYRSLKSTLIWRIFLVIATFD